MQSFQLGFRRSVPALKSSCRLLSRSFASRSYRTPYAPLPHDPSLPKTTRLLKELRYRIERDKRLSRADILRLITSIEDSGAEKEKEKEESMKLDEAERRLDSLNHELKNISSTVTSRGTTGNPLIVQRIPTGVWAERLTRAISFGFLLVLIYFLMGRSGGLLGEEYGDIFEEWDKYGNKVIRGGKAAIKKNGGKVPEKPNLVTFQDVAGCEEAKQDLSDIVYYLKNPLQFRKMGVTMPRGVLVTGPPGCGKTLLARALAGEAGVPFLLTDGASFDQVFVGIGSSRVRNLFKRAREIAPCIVFIDEIDAVASRRDEPRNPSRPTLNQLLVELDGFKQDSGVVVMGATNLPKILDHALTRPGRFDRTVVVELPDKQTRKQILKLYLKNHGGPDVNVDDLAGNTTGFSGADLKNLVNLAGIETVKNKLKSIPMALLDEAKEIIMMGRARKTMILSPEVRKLTAFHEGGHALVAVLTEGGDPVYKATLLPRGHALGMVSFQPTEDSQVLKSRESYVHELDTAMAGRAAEELIFGPDKITSGASSDFEAAKNIATLMVTRLGMSEKVGPVVYSQNDLNTLSPATKDLIAEEVRKLLDTSYARVSSLLKARRPQLTDLAQALLEKETLTLEEIKRVIKFDPKDVEPAANSSKSTFRRKPATI